jgi:hypothetical protein
MMDNFLLQCRLTLAGVGAAAAFPSSAKHSANTVHAAVHIYMPTKLLMTIVVLSTEG